MCPGCGKSIDIELEEVLFRKLGPRGLQGSERAAAERGGEKGVRDAGRVFAAEMGAARMGNTYPGYAIPSLTPHPLEGQRLGASARFPGAVTCCGVPCNQEATVVAEQYRTLTVQFCFSFCIYPQLK